MARDYASRPRTTRQETYVPLSSHPAHTNHPPECVYAWVQHSWTEVASVFIFSLIPSVIYYILVYTYYRQTIDPSHHANLLDNRSRTSMSASVRAPARGGRGGYARVGTDDASSATTSGMANARTRPAGASMAMSPRQRRAAQQAPYANPRNQYGTGSNASGSTSRPTAASTTSQSKRKFVSRSLQRSHRPPPLMQSPSPVGLTPGPPSYNNNRGRSRVYAAFVAPVESVEYDKFV